MCLNFDVSEYLLFCGAGNRGFLLLEERFRKYCKASVISPENFQGVRALGLFGAVTGSKSNHDELVSVPTNSVSNYRIAVFSKTVVSYSGPPFRNSNCLQDVVDILLIPEGFRPPARGGSKDGRLSEQIHIHERCSIRGINFSYLQCTKEFSHPGKLFLTTGDLSRCSKINGEKSMPFLLHGINSRRSSFRDTSISRLPPD